MGFLNVNAMKSFIGTIETAKKVTQETTEVVKTLSPEMERAQQLLTSTGDSLEGVRNGVAIIRNRAPFNKNLIMTQFFDVTSSTPKWMKTKYVSDGKLGYSPFGIKAMDCAPYPEGATSLKQRCDLYPEDCGAFASVKRYITRIFDRNGKIMEKRDVKNRMTPQADFERTVRSETTSASSHSVSVEPIHKPANGKQRGAIYEANGERTFYIG